MKSSYRYTLEPYKGMKTRHRCPECSHRNKTFKRYIDNETGEPIADHVGRCNRESNCGYHYSPKQYFQDNKISFGKSFTPYATKAPKLLTKPVSFIPVDVFKGSLKSQEPNHFATFLIDHFGIENTNELIAKYFIGTSNLWNGATVFWEIDSQGKIRTGKIMLYSPSTGKRVKEPHNHISWVHSEIKLPNFELNQCLFGEHLLQDKTKPIAIVESEKTALIASVYYPKYIWLATGGKDGLNAEKCSILKGRTVILFPDLSKPKENKLSTFEIWSNKAKGLSHIANFQISDLLELKATPTEREQGLDIADYLIRLNLSDFSKPEPKQQPEPLKQIEKFSEALTLHPIPETFKEWKPEPTNSENWTAEIEELERFFETATLPKTPIKLNQATTITNLPKFIDAHLSTVKANNGNKTFLPYLERLNGLKTNLIMFANGRIKTTVEESSIKV